MISHRPAWSSEGVNAFVRIFIGHFHTQLMRRDLPTHVQLRWLTIYRSWQLPAYVHAGMLATWIRLSCLVFTIRLVCSQDVWGCCPCFAILVLSVWYVEYKLMGPFMASVFCTAIINHWRMRAGYHSLPHASRSENTHRGDFVCACVCRASFLVFFQCTQHN